MRRKYSLLIFIIFTAVSCTLHNRGTQPAEFKSEGFLNDSYYQFIVIASPGKRYAGLTERRESAYLEGRNRADKTAREKLTLYCHSYYLSKHPGSKAPVSKFATGKLQSKLLPYTGKIYIYQEYYTEKDEAVLVFRIHGGGLKKEIDSLALSPD